MLSTLLSTHKKPITVVVVDDHHLMLKIIREMVAKREDIELVGEGHLGEHVLPLIETYQPNVLVLDLNMPQSEDPSSGRFAIMPTLSQLADQHPNTAIIIFTQHLFPAILQKAAEQGVSGYILKSDGLSLNLAAAIETVGQGGVYYSETILQKLREYQQGRTGIPLTKRQVEVLTMIHSYPNDSYRQNAERLGIKESTFKSHLNNAFVLLGAKNAVAAVIECFKLGILFPEERLG